MSDQGNSGNDLVFFGAMVAILLGIYAFFYFNFHYVAYIWKLLRYGEFYVASFVPTSIQHLINADFSGAFEFLKKTPSSNLMPETIDAFDEHFAKYLSWIPGAIIIFIGIKLNKSEVGFNKYDMTSLLRKMKDVFPYNARFLDYDPLASPTIYSRSNKESKATALSISPEAFARMNPPMGLEMRAANNELFQKSIWDGKTDFDTNLAELSFIAAFGSTYTGVENFSPAEKLTYDFLIDKIPPNEEEFKNFIINVYKSLLKVKSNDRVKKSELSKNQLVVWDLIEDNCNKVMKQSGTKLSRKQIFLNLIHDEKVEKLYRRKDVFYAFKIIEAENIFLSHSHVRIGMMTMLQMSRKTGVVNPMHINIVKDMDRTLWYCLVTVGREDVAFVEVAGLYSHWLIERKLGRSIPHPEVTEAVNGLYKALKLDLYEE